MYVCVHVCVCVCARARMFVCMCVCMCVRACMCARVCVRIHVYVCLCMCVCMCVYVHVYVCVRMCVCVCVFVYVSVCVCVRVAYKVKIVLVNYWVGAGVTQSTQCLGFGVDNQKTGFQFSSRGVIYFPLPPRVQWHSDKRLQWVKKRCPVTYQISTDGDAEVQRYPYSTLALGGEGVISATPRPLYLRERDPVSLVQEAGCGLGPVWMSLKNVASTGVRTVQPVASRCTVNAIPTAFSQWYLGLCT
jgi:hypothetical protein